MPENYHIHCLSETVSPLTHASGSAGNESIVSRELVMTPKGPVYTPVISGNAFRHRCVRSPGALWLIDLYGLRGKLTLGQLNFLLHGGNLTESNSHENTARIAEMKRTWPLLRLLGGCLPNQVLAGSMDSLRGVLICEENREHLPESILPAGRLLSSEQFITDYQYTRGDAGDATTNEAANTNEAAKQESSRMIFSGQAVCRGAFFLHGFSLSHVGPIELGAILWSLSLWRDGGGSIGGMAARGHGRLRTSIAIDPIVDVAGVVEEYRSHAESMRDDAVAWLEDAFAKKKTKKRKAASHA